MALSNVGSPLSIGGATGKGTAKGVFGVNTIPVYRYQATPTVLDADGIAAAQAVSGAGNLTINGALASGGTVTFAVPRTVQVVSSNAGDTTQTATIYGTDAYGVALVETTTLNGTDPKICLKAFKTVTRIAISAVCTGNISAGSTDVFGLPYRANSRADCWTYWDSAFVTTGTFTAAVTTSPATATTGDVRGTFWPASASDGTKILTLFVVNSDVDTNNGLYGVDQYGG